MWSFADRIFKTMSDVTVGTVIVLVHAVLAERASRRADTKWLAAPGTPITPAVPSVAARRSHL